MLVSELKDMIEDLDDTSTVEGVYVKRDPVQYSEKDGVTRFICSIVTKRGYSTTTTTFKYESQTVPVTQNKKPAEKVGIFAELLGGVGR